MQNKKYTATKKNGGVIPKRPVIAKTWFGEDVYDDRVLKIEIPCGNCIECCKQKARNWQIRLNEEIKDENYKYFITLTFAPQELEKLVKETGVGETNAIMTIAVRRMLEKWRKTHKKSLKHWLITELGHQGTERIHAHGIIWSPIPLEVTPTQDKGMYQWKYWRYGHIYVGEYVSARTVNYIVKYVTKIDTDHKSFRPIILTSPGMGKQWIDRMHYYYSYVRGKALDYYVMPNGTKLKLPTYYKNKLYNEEQREEIWRDFMDKDQEAVMGNIYLNAEENKPTIDRIKDKACEENTKAGYGNNTAQWKKKPYNVTLRMLKKGDESANYAYIRKKIFEKFADINLK